MPISHRFICFSIPFKIWWQNAKNLQLPDHCPIYNFCSIYWQRINLVADPANTMRRIKFNVKLMSVNISKIKNRFVALCKISLKHEINHSASELIKKLVHLATDEAHN